MNPAFRPALRADLVRRSDDGPSLYDPITDRDLALGPISLHLVDVIDGQRTVPELIAAVRERSPDASPAKIEQTLRMLLLLLVFDGPGKDILARAQGIQSGALKLEIEQLPDVRFACQSSGECCQNYHFGPLRKSDIARLEALDVASVYPALGPGPYIEALDSQHGKHFYLKTEDECCIFLQPDNKCGLHAAFGPESKPDLCRLYPFQSQATISGLAIYDHSECASFSRAAISGDTLPEQLAWLRPLMGEETELYHPTVTLMPGTQCDYGYVLRLRDALCALAAAGIGDEHQTLAAVGHLVHAFTSALASCPLADGEPEATVARVLGAPVESHYGGAAATPDAFRALAMSATLQFAAVIPRVARSKSSRRQLSSERLSRQYGEVIYAVRTLAEARADGSPPAAEYADLMQQPLAAGMQAASRRSLAYQLFSPRLLLDDRLMPALERVALTHVVTQVGARLAARAAGAPEVNLPHFDFGHMLAMRVLRQTGPVEALAQGKPTSDNPARVFDLVRAAAELCG